MDIDRTQHRFWRWTQWTCYGRLAVAIDETDWVAFGCSVSVPGQTYYVLFHRRLDGTWTEELAPFAGDYPGVLLAAGTGESVALCGSFGFHLRSAAGWGPEETVPYPDIRSSCTFAGCGSLGTFGIALAPDGERAAVGIDSPANFPIHPSPTGPTGGFGVWLSERTAAGWTVVPVGGPYDPFGTRPYLSRTALGQLVITMLNGGPGELPNASIYVEDP